VNESVFDHVHPSLLPLLAELGGELTKARTRFDPFNSPHEGYAVILEELDELWAHVKANTGANLDARSEALQVAAMGLRYIIDCAPYRHATAASGTTCPS
jgi:hypothetical protein